jgi:hypothetical protein
MSDDKARVYARGSALVPDFDAAEREPAIRRMIGRKYEQVKPQQWGWVPSGEPQALSKRAEVARALADGDLWAADEETAAWASALMRRPVKFDATFGRSASEES